MVVIINIIIIVFHICQNICVIVMKYEQNESKKTK